MYRGHRRNSLNLPQSHEFVFRRDRPIRGATIPPTVHANQLPPSANIQGATSRLNAQIAAHTPPGPSPRPRGQGQGLRSMADILPIIEQSVTPPPSDVASNRSEGANQTNGAGFFRLPEEGGSSNGSSRNNGTLTPELIFAEIGHGRGTSGTHSPTLPSRHLRRGHDAALELRQPLVDDDHRPLRPVPLPQTQTEIVHEQTSTTILPITTHQHQNTSQPRSPSVVWPYREPNDPGTPLHSPTRDLHGPVQPAPSADGRGRSVKRSFRNTLNVAEHYASSFLFGRSVNGQDDGNNSNTRGNGSGNVGGR
jgi:F-box and leucine-rich repeat protein GRR1